MKCRGCNKEVNNIFLDLGVTPPSNAFLNKKNQKEKIYPLKVFFCNNCYLVQTVDFASRKELFNKDYVYFSGYADTWKAHLDKFVIDMEKKNLINQKSGSFIVEIASNDGSLQEILEKKKYNSLGIEPTKSTAKVAKKKGLKVIQKFFGKDLATSLKKKFSPDLIVANNVMAHVPDINDFISGLKVLLKKSGVITVEFQHLLNIIKKRQFDTIYHEHYSYLSLISAQKIFLKHNLEIYDAEEISTHGGSLRIFIKHKNNLSKKRTSNYKRIFLKEKKYGLNRKKTYENFQKKVELIKKNFLKFLIKEKSKKKTFVAYGAAAKGNTFFNFLDLNYKSIDYIIDKNPIKIGKFLPGSKIEVKKELILKKKKPDYILIMPWNIKDEVIKQLRYIKKWNAKFITAIPNIKIY
jgi:2-polyprenyl-3-methyl-5-hydroxy-6-metoxy-1,4-benzoquinol methylase